MGLLALGETPAPTPRPRDLKRRKPRPGGRSGLLKVTELEPVYDASPSNAPWHVKERKGMADRPFGVRGPLQNPLPAGSPPDFKTNVGCQADG